MGCPPSFSPPWVFHNFLKFTTSTNPERPRLVSDQRARSATLSHMKRDVLYMFSPLVGDQAVALTGGSDWLADDLGDTLGGEKREF